MFDMFFYTAEIFHNYMTDSNPCSFAVIQVLMTLTHFESIFRVLFHLLTLQTIPVMLGENSLHY